MNLSSPAGLGFCGAAILLSRAKPGYGCALLSCFCSGGFIPPSSFCCRGAALLRPVWAGFHALTPGAPIKPFACVSMIAALQVWQSTRAGRLREKTPWTLLPRCPALLPRKAARARPSAPAIFLRAAEPWQPILLRCQSGVKCPLCRQVLVLVAHSWLCAPLLPPPPVICVVCIPDGLTGPSAAGRFLLSLSLLRVLCVPEALTGRKGRPVDVRNLSSSCSGGHEAKCKP